MLLPTFGEWDEADLGGVARAQVAGGKGCAQAQHESPIGAPWRLVIVAEQVEACSPVRQGRRLCSTMYQELESGPLYSRDTA